MQYTYKLLVSRTYPLGYEPHMLLESWFSFSLVLFCLGFEISHIANCVLGRNVAQLSVTLDANISQYYFHLIQSGYAVRLLAICAFLFLRFVYRAEWKAGVTLEQEAYVLKLSVILLFIVSVMNEVLQQLKDDTAEAPHIRRLIVLLLNDRDFRCTVPSWANMQAHVSLLLLPSGPVFQQLGWNFGLHEFLSLPGVLAFEWVKQLIPASQSIQTLTCALRQTPSKPKITNFHVTLARQQNICRFDVSMHDICLMNETDRHQSIIHQLQQMMLWEINPVFQ